MKRRICSFAFSLVCLFAAGCATSVAPPVRVDPSLFHDSAFAAPTHEVGADQLFELSAPMRAYLDSERYKKEARARGEEAGLASALGVKGALKLNYDDMITRGAADTFANGSGNCLSLVIMSAAFAKALKLDITYQSVRMAPDWSRGHGLYLASSHVNLILAPPRIGPMMPSASYNPNHSLTIDFVPPGQAAKYNARKIDEKTNVAMYLNNRAVEELGRQHVDNAYWWARAAVEKDPSFTPAYNTLGVIYQKRAEHARAEVIFKRALALEADDTVLMGNLVQALARQGKMAESALLGAQRARLEPAPPFFFFERGIQAMDEQRFSDAKQLFEREVQRAPDNHEFHYWLAMADLRLGQPALALDHLTLALDNSTSAESTRRYSSKLARLRAAIPGRAP